MGIPTSKYDGTRPCTVFLYAEKSSAPLSSTKSLLPYAELQY